MNKFKLSVIGSLGFALVSGIGCSAQIKSLTAGQSAITSVSYGILTLTATSGAPIPALSTGTLHTMNFTLADTSVTEVADLEAIAIQGPNAAAFTLDATACMGPGALAPGHSCAITVSFTGGALATATIGQLAIGYSSTSGDAQTTSSLTFDLTYSSVPVIGWRYPNSIHEFIAGYPATAVLPVVYNGGGNTFTYSVDGSGDALPMGITLDANTGLLSGTPTEFVTRNLQVCLTLSGTGSPGNCTAVRVVTRPQPVVTGSGALNPALCSAAGNGDSATPISLTTEAQFYNCLTNYPARHFVLANTIDLTAMANTQIGVKFTGILDGQSHTLSNYSLDCGVAGLGSAGGLFGQVYNGVIKNVTLNNFTIACGGAIENGILTGQSGGAIFQNIKIMNSTGTHGQISGGIVGLMGDSLSLGWGPIVQFGFIDKIMIDGLTLTNTTGAWAQEAMVVGVTHFAPANISRVEIKNSTFNTGGGNGVAAIVGYNTNADWGVNDDGAVWIDQANVHLNVTGGGAFTGGLYGFAAGGDTITNSMFVGNVGSGNMGAGTMFGGVRPKSNTLNLDNVIVYNSYSQSTVGGGGWELGEIIGDTSYRGFSGQIYLSGVKYETNGLPLSGGNVPDLSDAVALTAPQFLDPTKFPGWSSLWTINAGSNPVLADPFF